MTQVSLVIPPITRRARLTRDVVDRYPSFEIRVVDSELGIYLANVVAEAPSFQDVDPLTGEVSPHSGSLLHLTRTLVSTSRGGAWTEVSLHGSLGTDADKLRVEVVRAVASGRAPGFIAANGLVVGGADAARGQAVGTTVVSRDYGATWAALVDGEPAHANASRVSDGWHVLEIAHRGAVLTSIEWFDASSIAYYYSAAALTKAPSGRVALEPTLDDPYLYARDSLKPGSFWIFGFAAADTTIFRLDFSDVGLPPCTLPASLAPADVAASDFETFDVLAADGSCIDGRHHTFLRARADVECYDARPDGDEAGAVFMSGSDVVDTRSSWTPCACTADDWECAPGFRAVPNGTCVFATHVNSFGCVAPATYTAPAYRLVTGNGCVGGVDRASDGEVVLKCPTEAWYVTRVAL